MCAFFKQMGRLGAIIALVMLVVGLIKQLIALIGSLIFAIKFGVVVLFATMLILVFLSMLRGRRERKREVEEL